jgi:hypothetical protein
MNAKMLLVKNERKILVLITVPHVLVDVSIYVASTQRREHHTKITLLLTPTKQMKGGDRGMNLN